MRLAETLRDRHGDAGMLAVTLLLDEIWALAAPGAPVRDPTFVTDRHGRPATNARYPPLCAIWRMCSGFVVAAPKRAICAQPPAHAPRSRVLRSSASGHPSHPTGPWRRC